MLNIRTSECNLLMEAQNATTENPDARSLPFAMMESKILPLKLSSMDFLQIRVHCFLFTEYIIAQSLTGM